MSNLFLILIGAFLVVVDYTASKTNTQLDFKHDPKVRREVVYFYRVEYQDGYYIPTKDSVVNYYKGKEELSYDTH